MSRRKRICVFCTILIPIAGLHFLQTREDPNLRKLDEILSRAKANASIAVSDSQNRRPHKGAKDLIQIDLFVALVPLLKDRPAAGAGRPPLTATSTFASLGLLEDAPEMIRVLEELREAGEVQFVTRPKVISMSGMSSTIRSGGEVPITNSTTGKVWYKPFGTEIRCSPTICENGDIILEIRLDHTALDPTSNFRGMPCFSIRSVQTTAVGKEGKTLFMRGLMGNVSLHRTVNIPLLSDLPWIGPAFRFTSTTEEDREFLILATPRRVPAAREANSDITPIQTSPRNASASVLAR